MERYIALTTIVKEGSFTKASEKLGYTQSALSQMISSLEKELGITLLIRSHFGAKLSPDGKTIYPLIAQMVKNKMAVEEKAREIRGLEKSVINLSCFSSVAIKWIPSLVDGFRKKYPQIEFSIDIVDDEYAFNSVYEGNSDLAFTESCDFQKLKYVPLFKEDSMAVLPKGHRLSKYDVIPLEELLKEPFLSNCFSDKISTPLEFFASRGLSANVILRLEDNTSIMEMVERGIGVSILPQMVLNDEHFQIDIRRTEPMTTRNIYLAYVNKRALPVAAVRFMEYVIEEVPELQNIK